METGTLCPACGQGNIVTYSSFKSGDNQVRYLHCRACGYKPPDNKQVIPRRYVTRRFKLRCKRG